MVQYRQAHQCEILGPESPDRLEPVPELAVEPLVGIVVIELLFHVDPPDVDQPEAGPAPERPSRRVNERRQAVGNEYPGRYPGRGPRGRKQLERIVA